MVSDEQTNDPREGVPSGDNTNYQGGDMASNGVRNQGPARNAQIGGTPGSTGTGPVVVEGPDLSEAAHGGSIDSDSLSNFYPSEARDQQISGVRVVVRVTVEPDGRVSAARSVTDPGNGFGRAAERLLLSGAVEFTPGKDRNGRPTRQTITYPVRFELDS
jgi:periplasmic protein TonB